VPGHASHQLLYLLELEAKRFMFTADIGFGGESHLLHRCWGEREEHANFLAKETVGIEPTTDGFATVYGISRLRHKHAR
jgi:hypothetical protein